MCCAGKSNAHMRQTAIIFEQTEDDYHNMATKTNGPQALTSSTCSILWCLCQSLTIYRLRFRISLHCYMASVLSFLALIAALQLVMYFSEIISLIYFF